MTMSMARELAPRGVTVNAIAPGFIESDMTAELPSEIVDGALVSRSQMSTPARRPSSPPRMSAIAPSWPGPSS